MHDLTARLVAQLTSSMSELPSNNDRSSSDQQLQVTNGDQPVSSSFFDQLGQASRIKAEQTRAQLAAEYAEFKRLDQLRFEQRFLAKKNRRPNSQGEEHVSSTGQQQSKPEESRRPTRQASAPQPILSNGNSERLQSARSLTETPNESVELKEKIVQLEEQLRLLTSSMSKPQQQPPPSIYEQQQHGYNETVAFATSVQQGLVDPFSITQSRPQAIADQVMVASHLSDNSIQFYNQSVDSLVDDRIGRVETPNKHQLKLPPIIQAKTSMASPEEAKRLTDQHPGTNSIKLPPTTNDKVLILPSLVNEGADTSGNDKLNHDDKSKKVRYALELRLQMEEDRKRKEAQKEKDREFDRKLEEQWAKDGEVVKDTQQPPGQTLVKRVDNSAFLPSIVMDTQPLVNNKGTKHNDGTNPPDSLAGPDQSNHARGGNGIFGQPLTDAQKYDLAKYKAELKEQIDERQRLKEAQRAREAELDAKEARRVEADRERMQREFEREREALRRQAAVEQAKQQPTLLAKDDRSNKENKTTDKVVVKKNQTAEVNKQQPKSSPDVDQQKVTIASEEAPTTKQPRRKPTLRRTANPRSTTSNKSNNVDRVQVNPARRIRTPNKRDTYKLDHENDQAGRNVDNVLEHLKKLRSRIELEKKESSNILSNMKPEEISNKYEPSSVHSNDKQHPKVNRGMDDLFGQTVHNKGSRPGNLTRSRGRSRPNNTFNNRTITQRPSSDESILSDTSGTKTSLHLEQDRQLESLDPPVLQEENFDHSLIDSESKFLPVPDFLPLPLNLSPESDRNDDNNLVGEREGQLSLHGSIGFDAEITTRGMDDDELDSEAELDRFVQANDAKRVKGRKDFA